MWLWIPKVQASLKEIVVSKLREFSINQPWLVMVGKSAFDQRFYSESIRIVWLTFSSGRVKLKYTRHKRVYEINYLCMCSRTLFTIALQVGLTKKFFTQLPPLVMLINLFYCCLWIYFLLFNTVTISQWWPCWYIQFKKNKGESCCVERIPTVINKKVGWRRILGCPWLLPSPLSTFFSFRTKTGEYPVFYTVWLPFEKSWFLLWYPCIPNNEKKAKATLSWDSSQFHEHEATRRTMDTPIDGIRY